MKKRSKQLSATSCIEKLKVLISLKFCLTLYLLFVNLKRHGWEMTQMIL